MDKTRRTYYAAAALAVVLLLVILYMGRTGEKKTGSGFSVTRKVPDNPSNPQNYEYNKFLMARAAAGGAAHGDRTRDYNRGHDHGAGGTSRIDFDQAHGYYANDGLGELMTRRPETMMNTFHWDQPGTYQHTADTWGLPTGHSGDSRVNYSGFSREKMSVGAHWDQAGTYGHTGATLPDFGLSGYYEDVPTSTWS